MFEVFDKFIYYLLLLKLRHYDLSPEYNTWFTSYLDKRQNCVRVSGFLSRSLISISRVSQGSNLWTFLFLVLIKDFVLCIKHLQALMFPDNVKLPRPVTSITKCTLLQDEFRSVVEWCSFNNRFLNPRKIKVISLTRKRSNISNVWFHRMKEGEFAKFLGKLQFLQCAPCSRQFHCKCPDI